LCKELHDNLPNSQRNSNVLRDRYTTPLALNITSSFTQGSRASASTLGFATKRLWRKTEKIKSLEPFLPKNIML